MNEIQIVVSICIPGETEDENLYDQILLQKYSKRGLWFISGTISNNEPVKQSAKKIATEAAGTQIYVNKLLKVRSLKVGTITTQQHYLFLAQPIRTFLVEKSHNQKECKWADLSDLERLFASGKLLDRQPIYELQRLRGEYSGVYKSMEETSDYIIDTNVINTSQTNATAELISAAKISPLDQEYLCNEFFKYTSPSDMMDKATFEEFIKTKGIKDNFDSYFRSFDSQRFGCLTFKSLLQGLASMEPNTPHGGLPAEIRCRHMFDYYRKTDEMNLTKEDFRQIVHDIRRAKMASLNAKEVDEDAINGAKSFTWINDQLTLQNFLESVGLLKFRGTSCIYRLPFPVMTTIEKLDANTKPPYKRLRSNDMEYSVPESMESFDFKVPHSVPKQMAIKKPDRGYELATHSVRVKRGGGFSDVNSIWDLTGTCAVSDTNEVDLEGDTSRFHRMQSVDCFNSKSHANEMLNGLRYFERQSKNANGELVKKTMSWGKVQSDGLCKCLSALTDQVYEKLKEEPRLLKVKPPTFILGDIHGNFGDLICFEKSLWRMGPMLTPANYLFLGDYVDRGDHGIEVVSYLFAQKLLAPHKVFLLRGNHEVRDVQKQFNFYSQCIEMFGEKDGFMIWEKINRCFDVMPIAAVVDEKIFCVHGGIPSAKLLMDGPNYLGMEAINNIPCPLPNPEEDSLLAWDLMWSDPIAESSELMNDYVKEAFEKNEGFAPNTRRGAGNFWSLGALKSFLEKNGFSHVIRAHEVKEAGFQVQYSARLLTVFSSSYYCGGSNEAACILVDANKLRVIRLDTT